MEIYDPSTDTWCMGPSLTGPRRGCGIAVRKGQLIVVGGTDGSQSMCTTEILDSGKIIALNQPFNFFSVDKFEMVFFLSLGNSKAADRSVY